MTTKIEPKIEDGQTPCRNCAAPVWLALFKGGLGSGDWRRVERAPLVRTTVGKVLRERFVGHVALTFPLAGTSVPIAGSVTRKLTNYRLHVCRAFSAANFDRKVRPEAEPPTVTPIGNLHDLFEKVDPIGGGK